MITKKQIKKYYEDKYIPLINFYKTQNDYLSNLANIYEKQNDRLKEEKKNIFLNNTNSIDIFIKKFIQEVVIKKNIQIRIKQSEDDTMLFIEFSNGKVILLSIESLFNNYTDEITSLLKQINHIMDDKYGY
jgi:hypothetical protein